MLLVLVWLSSTVSDHTSLIGHLTRFRFKFCWFHTELTADSTTLRKCLRRLYPHDVEPLGMLLMLVNSQLPSPISYTTSASGAAVSQIRRSPIPRSQCGVGADGDLHRGPCPAWPAEAQGTAGWLAASTTLPKTHISRRTLSTLRSRPWVP